MKIWVKCYENYESSYIMGVFTEEEMIKNKSETVKKIIKPEIESLQEQIDHVKEERKPLQESFLEMCNNPVDKDSLSYKEYKKNRRLIAHKIEWYSKQIRTLQVKIDNLQEALNGDSFWIKVVLSRENINYRDYILNEEYIPTEDKWEFYESN